MKPKRSTRAYPPPSWLLPLALVTWGVLGALLVMRMVR